MIEIHELSRNDIPRIRALSEEVFAGMFDASDDENVWEENYSRGGIFLGAFDGDELVGFKCGYRRSDEEFRSWIGGVHPRYRRKGIARRLAEQQEKLVKARGCKRITTSTFEELSPEMYTMLKSSGYEIVDTMRVGKKIKTFFRKDI